MAHGGAKGAGVVWCSRVLLPAVVVAPLGWHGWRWVVRAAQAMREARLGSGEPSGADGLDRRASESLPPSPADPLGAAVAVESLRLGASPSGRARSPLGGRDRGRSRSSSGGGQTAEETARALFPDSPPHERGPKP